MSERVGFVGNAYWDVFLSKDVSDPVIKSFRNVRDLKLRPLRAGRLRVFFVGNAYWDVFLSKDVSDPVIKSFRNVRDLKVRLLRGGRLRVSLKILWAFCLL